MANVNNKYMSSSVTSLAHFLAWKLTERGDGIWESMVERLESKSALERLYRRAKARVDDDTNERAICRVVILDWMKTTERQKDKVIPIERALEECGLTDLKQECHEFVTYQKEHLSDAKIAEFASKLSGNIEEVGQILELGESVMKKIVEEHPNDPFDQKEACLQAWRCGDTCVRSGTNAVERLKEFFSI